MSRIRPGSLLFVGAMVISACGGTAAPTATASTAASAAPSAAAVGKPEKSSLTIGLPVAATSFLPVYLAAAQTDKEEGLDVKLVTFKGDAQVVQALAGGSIDIAVASPNGLFNMIKAGQPVIGFYAGFYQADFAWLARPEIKTWSALKGGTIGVSTFGSLTDFLTRYSLKKNGLEPEKDVKIVQAGGSPTAYQALVAGRLSAAILAPPFKWQAREKGMNEIGVQTKDVAPEWPKHIFYTTKKFLSEDPNTVTHVLRAHVLAIRLAKSDRAAAVKVMEDDLKYSAKDADRAYDDVIGAYNERGTLPPAASMKTFWDITIQTGDVTEAWPDSKFLDTRYIDTFAAWAP
ncbi:MAG: ABC transporter substrate-binding protein [Chloroflexota bacterium]|nr:ABC transporter substrate-binding protein [Chloroflexota bacterium]